MTALLTENLPLLAGAPNGIKKLRELILELAVRGKLVPQEPSDEPASELLNNIAKEKALLIENKNIRKGKPLPGIEQDEMQFKLPIGWEWVRLGQIGDWGAGATPARGNSRYYDGEMPWFKSGELIADFISDSEESVTELALKECSLRRNKPGDVLIAMYGATIGKTAILSVEGTTNQAVCACTPFNGVFNRYLLLTLKALKSNFIGQGAGGAQPNISREKIVATVTGLPPLAEQHRIVAKVDELMALCDRLEAQQTDAESAHAQLVQALLDSLTQASDATDVAANWQRLAEHFHTLFTTEPSIDALKQTLLQLAVMGKLVPQDPSDEPAGELLKRIAEEKALLVAEGKIRKTKQLPEITDEERSFAPPNGWEFVRFGQVIELVSGQHLGPDEYFESARDGAIPYLTGPADFGETYPRPTRFTHERRATSIEGDILLTVKGSGVGKTNFVNQQEFAISRQLMAIRPILVDVQFARNMLFSMSEHFQSKSIGIAIPGISREDVLDTLIGIPPLPEQHRIVAKVDQLMALCDQLKTRLSQARQLNEQLASTLVEQAVA